MEINSDIIGSIAAFLTTVCFIPQACKVIKSKHTEGISIIMYVLFSTGVFFWFIYGVMLNSLPIIIANFITFALALTILVTVIKERKKSKS